MHGVIATENIDGYQEINYKGLDEVFLFAFAAFFSFAVKSGFFLVVFLLSWPLLMIISS